VVSVEDALETDRRTFAQWTACLDAANHFALRVKRNVHRRGAGGSRPESVAWRALKLLSNGQSLTAEQIARRIGRPHVDVVRRKLKRFRSRGFVTTSPTYSRFEPRRFTITARGRWALGQLEACR
jgi:SOS-response transcriptional repressor LexA